MAYGTSEITTYGIFKMTYGVIRAWPQKDGSGRMFQTSRHSDFEFVSANLKNGRYSDFEFKVFTNTLETAEPFQFSFRKAG